MTDSKTAAKSRLPFIFATIFLDSLGIGIMIPIMPDLIRRFSSDPIFIATYFGYFMSAYALMQFLASPVLGSLSDRFGRRPVLLMSLLGAGIDYVIMAFAPSLVILFVGRIISGLTGASFTVATAYMADISDDTNRSSNFGMIGAAFGIGFIIGPALGGLAADFGHSAPFLLAAALNLLNFAFGFFILPESLPVESRRKIVLKKLNPLRSMIGVVKPSAISLLVGVYVLLWIAGHVHPSIWALYTEMKFNWTPKDVGLSLAVVGVVTAFSQGYLTRILIPKIGEPRALLLGIYISIVSFAGYAFATKGWMLFAILIPSAFSGVSMPALQSLVSKGTPPSEQGELQGSLVSLGSLTAVVSPLMYTSIFGYFTSLKAPVQFPGAGYLLASVISIFAVLLALKSPQVAERGKVVS